MQEKEASAEKKGMDTELFGGDNREKKPSAKKKETKLCSRRGK